MITQQIRTSKFNTTIDIPAYKLQTNAKLIQVPRQNHSQSREQTITLPGCCHCEGGGSSNASTRLVIEELEKAYNDDMLEWEDRIKKTQKDGEAKCNQMRAHVEQLLRDLQNEKKAKAQSEKQYAKVRGDLNENKGQILKEIDDLKRSNFQLQGRLRESNAQIEDLTKQKYEISSMKIRQFTTGQEEKFQRIIRDMQSSLDQSHSEKNRISQEISQLTGQRDNLLEKDRQTEATLQRLMDAKKKLEDQNNFLNKEIETYLKQVSEKEKDIQAFKRIIEGKDDQITQLIKELSQQSSKPEEFKIRGNTQKESYAKPLHDSQLKDMAGKIVYLQDMIQKQQELLVDAQAKLLMKLKDCDGLNSEIYQLKIKLQGSTDVAMKLQLLNGQLRKQNDKLSIQLSKKMLECSELLSRPPQQKVYEVKIEKCIEKKEYICSLETKIQQLNEAVEQLQQGNQSYATEIKKRLKKELDMKANEEKLHKYIKQLKEYIERKQKSIQWVVEREIRRDVDISQSEQQRANEGKQDLQSESGERNSQYRASNYKVKVRSRLPIDHDGNQDQVSQILRKDPQTALNISVQSKALNQ